MMEEIWKSIEGFEGYYQVSNLGRVRSLDRVVESRKGNWFIREGRILKPKKMSCGYLYITLHKNGEEYIQSIHRLVGFAFVPGYQKGLVINHKDENPHNNAADNLEWVTQLDNVNYGNHAKKSSLSHSKKKVLQLDLNDNVLCEYKNLKEASASIGNKSISGVSSVCNGRLKQYRGFKWRFK